MTSNILLINRGGSWLKATSIRFDLIDEHPHMVRIKAERPRDLAQRFLATITC
jgi:hypothetical protein